MRSTPGSRDPLLSRAVLNQFAPETNPRYGEGENGHTFLWDFTHAMHCTVPRYRANGVMTLAQLCAWFRTLSPDAGWIRVSGLRAAELATLGSPVVALPKSPRLTLIAVAVPDERAPEGHPLLASACQFRRGNRLTTRDAFGERHAEYFFHE